MRIEQRVQCPACGSMSAGNFNSTSALYCHLCHGVGTVPKSVSDEYNAAQVQSIKLAIRHNSLLHDITPDGSDVS